MERLIQLEPETDSTVGPQSLETGNEELTTKKLMNSAAPIITYRLYFLVQPWSDAMEKLSETYHLFSTDNLLKYESFFNDFGPLNISMVYRYCHLVNGLLERKEMALSKIVHHTSTETTKLLNAAFLIGSYSIIYLHHTPQSILRTLFRQPDRLGKFCDASQNPSSFLISLHDCLCAMAKAHRRRFFNFADFDYITYEYYERVENGDLNWIVPGKFLAFCGPHRESRYENGMPIHSPEAYFRYFEETGVTTIIRLNMRQYDAKSFTERGFDHFDLFFVDGGTPSDMILRRFLSICEVAKGAIAVHCKAGLGRTGTLIAAYLIKHYSFSAHEAIAWLRICRPGSVIGHQQTWLQDKESFLLAEGNAYRRTGTKITPDKHPFGIYSLRQPIKVLPADTGTSENSKQVQEAPSNEGAPKPAATTTTTGSMERTLRPRRAPMGDRVCGISRKVDTMRLSDEDERLNNNHVIVPADHRTTATAVANRSRSEAKSSAASSATITQQPSTDDGLTVTGSSINQEAVTHTQGDQLTQIKATRHRTSTADAALPGYQQNLPANSINNNVNNNGSNAPVQNGNLTTSVAVRSVAARDVRHSKSASVDSPSMKNDTSTTTTDGGTMTEPLVVIAGDSVTAEPIIRSAQHQKQTRRTAHVCWEELNRCIKIGHREDATVHKRQQSLRKTRLESNNGTIVSIVTSSTSASAKYNTVPGGNVRLAKAKLLNDRVADRVIRPQTELVVSGGGATTVDSNGNINRKLITGPAKRSDVSNHCSVGDVAATKRYKRNRSSPRTQPDKNSEKLRKVLSKTHP
ncbi:dual specificity protein phosphatase CDC14A-like [Anopheles albimanus]|uniref:dual specificity protein phosphatase CDC14A-like n=1 Tax=Anopheles albimanus TaxID=7167 RepID=UPI0016418050|nr:dual specificity protein phosphatase CDC14A-like [Anopheles albimanus]XP_035784734.1 dual specificity protein phosphatase CDC14A-like [Anopheles albimanus]XP_035784735.1 dual specificity protein phosphatase CDC14A-like [Anopheles albimanus]